MLDSKALQSGSVQHRKEAAIQSVIKFGVKMICSAVPGKGDGLEQVAGVRCSSIGCFIWMLTGSPGQSPSLLACVLLMPYLGGASRDSLGLCCSSKIFHKKILQIFEILKAVEFTGIVSYYREKCQTNRTRVLKSSGRDLQQENTPG